MRVLGIAGSLRTGSYNRALLRAAVELAPEGMQIEPADIGGIPLYNGDLDTDANRPPAVVALKDAVASADGVLFVSPEHNHSVPGVMQNAIDWISRPGNKSVLAGKPVAVIGASTGIVGTARGQQILKLTLMSTLALVMPHPGVLVGQAQNKFTDGTLTDEPTRGFLKNFLEQFRGWIVRLG